jgi:hypothetical protein
MDFSAQGLDPHPATNYEHWYAPAPETISPDRSSHIHSPTATCLYSCASANEEDEATERDAGGVQLQPCTIRDDATDDHIDRPRR